jgi:hypothetical protein
LIRSCNEQFPSIAVNYNGAQELDSVPRFGILIRANRISGNLFNRDQPIRGLMRRIEWQAAIAERVLLCGPELF